LGQRWRPLRHTSDVIRHCATSDVIQHCAETTVGQTLLIDSSGHCQVFDDKTLQWYKSQMNQTLIIPTENHFLQTHHKDCAILWKRCFEL